MELSRKQAITAVIKGTQQKIKVSCSKELPLIRERYCEVLVNRKDDKDHMPLVDKFFESLPKNDGEKHESFYCALSHLSELYGNEVYVPPEVYVRGKNI